ncbi:mitogen-activated protein kinase kinase kinase 18 [Musa acuminata AAA Group]|uniref:mitogen-activated protein kinase kinase kinase 18 n=1 Tax=Musa acuminata AAA Group TaxID=214697 RepID=UPI0031CE0B90
MGIGGWRRGRVIGRGSSATVLLATDLDSGEVFAVKSVELSRSAVLQREQRILSSLGSPYVVSCFGFDVSSHRLAGGLYYNLFMEYAPRGSLSDEIVRHGGRLDEAAIRSYTYQILRGLAYLHSEGVVHCDVKGRNVLIGSDGRAKIADLGCASLIDENDRGGGECRGLRGTPMFMAPEVARGEEQGPPADVWALGCTVIEMATGRPPWPDVPNAIGVVHRIAFSRVVPDFPSWLSAEGKDFLSKCFKRDPSERWTAEQLLRHEFVASSRTNPSSKPDSDRFWASPKSTLDQAFWESFSEQSAEHPSHDEPSARIQHLISSSSSPNWTWDENWVAVRSDGEDCHGFPSCPAGATTDGEITVCGDGSKLSSIHRMDTVDSFHSSHEFGVINSNSGHCDTSFVQVAEGEERQFVSCKTEVYSSTNLRFPIGLVRS